MVGERIARVQSLAAAEGLRIRFGIRLHVIARDSPGEAWAVAERWLDEMEPAAVELVQERLARSSSVGQQRMLSLHGSHTEVAERFEEYRALGCDEFILSGFPIWKRPIGLRRASCPC